MYFLFICSPVNVRVYPSGDLQVLPGDDVVLQCRDEGYARAQVSTGSTVQG